MVIGNMVIVYIRLLKLNNFLTIPQRKQYVDHYKQTLQCFKDKSIYKSNPAYPDEQTKQKVLPNWTVLQKVHLGNYTSWISSPLQTLSRRETVSNTKHNWS